MPKRTGNTDKTSCPRPRKRKQSARRKVTSKKGGRTARSGAKSPSRAARSDFCNDAYPYRKKMKRSEYEYLKQELQVELLKVHRAAMPSIAGGVINVTELPPPGKYPSSARGIATRSIIFLMDVPGSAAQSNEALPELSPSTKPLLYQSAFLSSDLTPIFELIPLFPMLPRLF